STMTGCSAWCKNALKLARACGSSRNGSRRGCWRLTAPCCTPRAVHPQGGIVSPPTQWQPFFFGIVITRIRVDPKHAIDLVTRDFPPLAQRPDEVALARPGGRLQPVVESGGKVLQPADNPLQLPGPGGFLRQRLALLLQPGKAQAQAGKARRKRGLANATLRLPVDQPGQ